MTDVAAHDQPLTIHLVKHIAEHPHREDDPNYHLFEQAKARLKKQGLWKCIIADRYCEGGAELHHQWVQFSDIPTTDPKKIAAFLGLHLDSDEEFQAWVESPGNLEVLCATHHRTRFGIHMLPGPDWNAVRFAASDLAMPPAEFVPARALAATQRHAADGAH